MDAEEPAAVHCRRCNQPLRVGAEYCSECGTAVAEPPAADGAPQTEPEANRGALFAGWVLVAIGAIGVGIAGISLASVLLREDHVVDLIEVSDPVAEDGTTAGTVYAPNLLDLQIDEARTRLTGLGLPEDEVEVETVTSPLGNGTVIDQVPRPGELLNDGITLTVAEGSTVMPDVIGLDLKLALQALESAGIPAERVTTEAKPFASVADLILEQSPRAGAVDPTNVVLTAAIPPSAPDLSGLTVADADALLAGIGTELLIEAEQSLDGVPGTVLAQSIAPGTAVEGPIRVTIAQEPDSVPVSSLPVDEWSRCSSSNITIGGTAYSDGWDCESTLTSESWIRFDLPAGVMRFRAKAAVSSDSAAGELFLVVYADGIAVDLVTVAHGESVEVDSGIPNARQLELRVSSGSGSMLLVEARVVAAPEGNI
jgi:beta-lactam-binding protein with PASTA domain